MQWGKIGVRRWKRDEKGGSEDHRAHFDVALYTFARALLAVRLAGGSDRAAAGRLATAYYQATHALLDEKQVIHNAYMHV